MSFRNKRAAAVLVEQVFLFLMGLIVLVAVYTTFSRVQTGFESKRMDVNAEDIALQTAIAAADLQATASAGRNASASRLLRFPRLEGPYSIELSGREVLVQYQAASSTKRIPAPADASGKAYSDRALLLSYSPDGTIRLEAG